MGSGFVTTKQNGTTDEHVAVSFGRGKWYLAQYGQFDGYPEGQGLKILKFLSVARNIENLKTGLEKCVYEPTKEELEAINAECDAWDRSRTEDMLESSQPWEMLTTYGIRELYPSLARETSAGILGIIARAGHAEAEDGADEVKKIPVQLGLAFANDSLFCEWAYVIDLDKEVFEVYGGSERKHDGHRFAAVGNDHDPVPRFLCSIDFSQIFLMKSADEFLSKVQAAANGEVSD